MGLRRTFHFGIIHIVRDSSVDRVYGKMLVSGKMLVKMLLFNKVTGI